MLITCRHFKLQGVYKEFNIFICFSVKPSVAVTEQSVENKNKRMFMEVLHQMLTRQKQDTQQHLVTNGQGNWKTWQSYSIFTIMISFLISLCAEVLKISLSIHMVRETGSLSKIPLPVAVFSCFCFLFLQFEAYIWEKQCICYMWCRVS